MFTAMGVEAFAQRAERELLATGERARDGLSNPEIGARLFLSPRTVAHHLHKVFNKLQIGSRTEFQRALPSEPQPALVS